MSQHARPRGKPELWNSGGRPTPRTLVLLDILVKAANHYDKYDKLSHLDKQPAERDRSKPGANLSQRDEKRSKSQAAQGLLTLVL
jgi:hypothetical protein